MALYFNDYKFKIKLGNYAYRPIIYLGEIIIDGIALLSSDGYLLKDWNGAYLVEKEND